MSVCPNLDKHTPAPATYLGWHEWAEQMTLTHDQRRCPGCGLYAVWDPKPGVDEPLPPLLEHGCIAIRLHI